MPTRNALLLADDMESNRAFLRMIFEEFPLKKRAQDIRERGRNRAEMLNERVCARIQADASFIHWDGRDAAMVICDRIEDI